VKVNDCGCEPVCYWFCAGFIFWLLHRWLFRGQLVEFVYFFGSNPWRWLWFPLGLKRGANPAVPTYSTAKILQSPVLLPFLSDRPPRGLAGPGSSCVLPV